MSEENNECRICFESEKHDDLFISPCRCSGTSKYVHISCLNTWRKFNINNPAYNKCMECNYEYIIVSRYPIESTDLFPYTKKACNFYIVKTGLSVPICFIFKFFSAAFGSTAIVDSLNGGRKHLDIYEILNKDFFASFMFYYLYSFVLTNFILIIYYLFVTYGNIKRKNIYYNKMRCSIISNILFNLQFYFYYFIFVYNNQFMVFMNIALFLFATEPIIAFKLIRQHHYTIQMMNIESGEEIMPYGEENPMFNIEID